MVDAPRPNRDLHVATENVVFDYTAETTTIKISFPNIPSDINGNPTYVEIGVQGFIKAVLATPDALITLVPPLV